MNGINFLTFFVLLASALAESAELIQMRTYGKLPPPSTAVIVGGYENKILAVFPDDRNLYSLDLL